MQFRECRMSFAVVVVDPTLTLLIHCFMGLYDLQIHLQFYNSIPLIHLYSSGNGER